MSVTCGLHHTSIREHITQMSIPQVPLWDHLSLFEVAAVKILLLYQLLKCVCVCVCVCVCERERERDHQHHYLLVISPL
jgi:hypothetical protein